jgi:polypeptide N-acetylgalactosaminyltransferase
MTYPADLPSTSVVFVFFNEPLSPLLRSIHSVFDRTPPHLLYEVILVDDGSTAEWLQKPLEDYIKLLPNKVKLVRRGERSGLMDARVDGARAATGPTVTFLDSHIEVSPQWLEPLMARIKEDPHHVVMPIIDSIDADSFEYRRGGLDILGFSWGLGQKSIGGRRRTRTEPMPSPIMAGGLFSMDRKYFFELGAYDPGMKLYGGEEMEISFRIWQCGGTLECIPCSRVGHVFRTGEFWRGQVYSVPGDVIVKNKLRAAAVWMDEYADIVRRVMPPLPPGKELGDISFMQNIRTKFNCKPFKWFLQNVYPEMFVPNDPTFVAASGEIRNPAANACFDTLGASHQGAKIGVYPCHHSHGTQEFVYSHNGDVRVAAMDFDNCLDRGNGDGSIGIWPCHQTGGNQHWKWEKASGILSDDHGTLCAEVRREPTKTSPFTLVLAPCDASKPEQKWIISEP